ncbi:MAG: type II secretion system F family protein [Cytophagales bacterium]|nr:type II secretion system F family protein [Cytophagales bacterium]
MSLQTTYNQWRFKRNRKYLYSELVADMRASASDRQQDLLYAKMRKWGDRAAERKDGFADIYYTVADRMEEGLGLGKALQGMVPEQEASLIMLSESVGDLHNGLENVVRMVETDDEIRAKLGSAAAYPLFLLAAILVLLVMIGSYFPSTLLTMIPLKLWSPRAQGIIEFCVGFAKYWPLTIGGMVALIAAYFWSKDNWSGSLRAKVDRWSFTPYRLHADKTALGMVSQLGGSVAVGMQLNQALDAMSTQSKQWQAWHLDSMLIGIDVHPTKPSLAMDTGLFPQSILDAIEDSSGRDGLGPALRQISIHGIKNIVDKISRRAKVMNMAMILGVGLLLGYVMVNLYMGMGYAQRNLMRQSSSISFVVPIHQAATLTKSS